MQPIDPAGGGLRRERDAFRSANGFSLVTAVSLGSMIRLLRESRRIGLRSLARATSLSPSYLSRIERDCVSAPSAEVLIRIARELRTDSDTLLTAAGLLPESILRVVQSRPDLIKKIVSLVDGLTDDQVDAFCEEWRRRIPLSSAQLSPR